MPDEFTDYYELMQISAKAEAATIQRVYRMLASRYHPDNPESGDTDKFVLLQRAYAVLSNSDERAAYDAELNRHSTQPLPVFELKDFVVGIDAEVNRRLGVLCLLYNRRKTNPDNPGFSVLDLETKMAMPREHLEFTIWYLREKGHVRRDETSNDIMVTSEGVDFVESNLPQNQIVYKLLKSAEGGSGWRAEEKIPTTGAEQREPDAGDHST
jgi:curved DNA-binding protein